MSHPHLNFARVQRTSLLTEIKQLEALQEELQVCRCVCVCVCLLYCVGALSACMCARTIPCVSICKLRRAHMRSTLAPECGAPVIVFLMSVSVSVSV